MTIASNFLSSRYPSHWFHSEFRDTREGLPGGGGGGPCHSYLVPFQNCPMFPCSHTLSECFRTIIFRILFPCSQKLVNVPLFPSIFCQCSLVPQNPWETLTRNVKYQIAKMSDNEHFEKKLLANLPPRKTRISRNATLQSWCRTGWR